MPDETPAVTPPSSTTPSPPATATAAIRQRREHSRLLPLVLIFLGWLFFFPDNPANIITTPDFAAIRLNRQLDALDVLNSTKWGDFSPVIPKEGDGDKDAAQRFLNLTGFRKNDGLAWEDLNAFRDHCVGVSRAVIPPAKGEDLWLDGQGEPVWQNASGRVRGTWVRRDASVRREATSYNLTAITPDIEWAVPELPWARNITGTEGRMKIRIRDKANDDADGFDGDPIYGAGMVRAEITIDDTDGTGHNWDMRLHGVHWKRHGAILLTTTSEKFDGIFALPHLAPGPEFFKSSQVLLNRTISRKLRERARYLSFDARIPWTSEIDDVDIYNPTPHCEYLVYAQIMPLDRTKLDMSSFDPENESIATVIFDIEQELKYPQGAPIRGVPPLQLAAVVYSPDCAFFLDTKGPPNYVVADGRHLIGTKAEVYRSTLNNCLLIYTLIFIGQILLLKQQIRETCTPSTMGRVSFYTGVMMLMADFLVVTSVTAFMLSSDSSMQSLTLMFSAFISMFVGGTFLYQIFEVQQQEWVRRANRAAAAAAQSNTGSSTAPGTGQTSRGASTPATGGESEPTERDGLLARPETPEPPNETTPIIVPSDQDIDAEIADAASAVPTAGGRPPTPQIPTFSAVITRIALFTSCFFFLLVASITWYAPARSALLNIVIFAYLSLWLPQIHRNIQRNCRRALSWRFTVGQSVLRLVPVAYFYCHEDNILFVQPDRRMFAAFAGWVWVQLWVMGFQDVLGPRFGIPSAWTPEAWDYHPVLREDSLEAGKLPLALSEQEDGASPGVGSAPGVRTVDCAICREILELPILPAASSASSTAASAAAASATTAEDRTAGVAAVLGTSGYMVTPCRHVFHSKCLEGWMRFRLQCPICREDLPPL
ncbi:hypothetical protein jhhlp_008651 [Lomentospora prolificans]|uniref:RING-type E3 ubiquitin transferase n=1 Tax=Lomentospora prolificans TaxID=41688 RepID=A0A2N3MYM8_9PEZI|nr:hypothetical protein jhhlp_008651 [Lomentospora prolificans]